MTHPQSCEVLYVKCTAWREVTNQLPCSGQEQGLEGSPAERAEHRRGVRGAAVRPRPRHHGRHPRVLLEQPQECHERQVGGLLVMVTCNKML